MVSSGSANLRQGSLLLGKPIIRGTIAIKSIYYTVQSHSTTQGCQVPGQFKINPVVLTQLHNCNTRHIQSIFMLCFKHNSNDFSLTCLCSMSLFNYLICIIFLYGCIFNYHHFVHYIFKNVIDKYE